MKPCDFCGEKSMVMINNFGACEKHIEDATRSAVSPFKKALRRSFRLHPSKPRITVIRDAD